ncbi:hypothetical protein SDC9_95025 [bioreactor metagenome]|uniref:Uncharacterized protein n=1 Tax=bioreactor metagenome TaxID=1076179 RepID=A0A645A7N8_9ZZZZ
MLLQGVTHAGDIGGDLVAVGQANTGDLTQSGVGLLGGSRSHSGADASLLRGGQIGVLVLQGIQAELKRGGSGLVGGLLPSFTDQLVKSRHIVLLSTKYSDCKTHSLYFLRKAGRLFRKNRSFPSLFQKDGHGGAHADAAGGAQLRHRVLPFNGNPHLLAAFCKGLQQRRVRIAGQKRLCGLSLRNGPVGLLHAHDSGFSCQFLQHGVLPHIRMAKFAEYPRRMELYHDFLPQSSICSQHFLSGGPFPCRNPHQSFFQKSPRNQAVPGIS